MEKSGLIVEGGGMKCAYSAGILDAFLDDNVTFDYCMGVSAGAANTASYLAGQRGRNLRFYIEHAKIRAKCCGNPNTLVYQTAAVCLIGCDSMYTILCQCLNRFF